ncbi:MAG: Omp28-related outer membrane protein [Flavobacteriaceae bacterium]|jgi:thiol-disulfide isomerase/thioredoxin|nr:Omp28-related outer membrane protein [Flavobacteriaceae bacterium]
MKRKNLLKFAVILSLVTAFTSCSKDDNSSNKGEDKGKTDGPAPFQHKVLVEDFTGAWCQYCPIVAHDIEELEKTNGEKIQAIAIHNSVSADPNNGGYDPFDFFPTERKAFEREMKVNGYPFARANRAIDFRATNGIKSTIDAYLSQGSPIGVKINSNLKIDSGTIDISIKLAKTFEKGLKYAIFVLEDGLIFRQSNATQFFPPVESGWTKNFVHNNTLIAIPNGFRGDYIDSAITLESKEITVNGTPVTYKAQKVENLKVVVVISDADNNILNTVVAKANTKQDYQLKK